MVRQQLYMEQIHKKNFMLLVLLCTLNRLVMMSSGVSCSMLRSLTKKHSQLSKNTLRTLRAHFYTLLSRVVRPAELHSRSAEENCMTENVASLRSVKVATPPCAANAAIPCGLAVRKQHKMLFAASKFEKLNTEKLTVDWSHYAKS